MNLKRFRFIVTALLGLSLLVLTACKPTPGYLRRWANREGSEEMFAEYLVDPDVSHDVHVTALELLIDQWDYSSAMLRGGGLVRDMPNAGERDATLRDALPHLRENYDQGGNTRIKMRDAAYQLRQGTDNPEVIALYDGVIDDWLTNHWGDLCREQGTITVRQMLEAVGPEVGAAHVAQNIAEKPWDQLVCQAQQIREVSWLSGNDTIATAYTERWAAGDTPESEQMQVNILEEWQFVGRSQVMRSWLFNQLAHSQDLTPLVSNIVLNILLNSAEEDPSADVPGYVEILQHSTTVARWSAFEQIVKINGSQGLELALTSLPADGNYAFWQGQEMANGLERASTVVCGLERLGELGDNTRPVFEAHIADTNIVTRAVSIQCLQTFGNATTATALEAQLGSLGAEPVTIPYWGSSLQELITATVTAIRAR